MAIASGTPAKSKKLTVASVLKQIETEKIRWIDLQFVDLLGSLQHITIPSTSLGAEEFKRGVGKLDGSSIKGFKEIHESDMLMSPDPASFAVLPWYEGEHRTARFYVDIYEGGSQERFTRDSRFMAQKAVKFAAEQGFDMTYWGPEIEFFVFDGIRLLPSADAARNPWSGAGYEIISREAPWNDSSGEEFPIRFKEGYYPAPPVDSLQDFRNEACRILIESFGMTLDAHHHEVATAGSCQATKPLCSSPGRNGTGARTSASPCTTRGSRPPSGSSTARRTRRATRTSPSLRCCAPAWTASRGRSIPETPSTRTSTTSVRARGRNTGSASCLAPSRSRLSTCRRTTCSSRPSSRKTSSRSTRNSSSTNTCRPRCGLRPTSSTGTWTRERPRRGQRSWSTVRSEPPSALSRLAPGDCLEPPIPDPLDLVLSCGDLRTRGRRLWTRCVPRSSRLVGRSPSVRFPRPHDLRNRGTFHPPFRGSGARASEPRNRSGRGRDRFGRDCPGTASAPDRRPTSLVRRGRVVRWPASRDSADRADRPASGSPQGGPARHRPSGCLVDRGRDGLSSRGVRGICPRGDWRSPSP